MDLEEIRQTLTTGLEATMLELEADGNRLLLTVISDKFSGLNKVKRQQMVYALLNERISSGEIHAVSMVTRTPDES